MITILPNTSRKEHDSYTVCISDLMSGKNKVTFDCHLSSLLDIINSNIHNP